jgi:hypothetical protein
MVSEVGMTRDCAALERLQSENGRALTGFWEWVRGLEPRAMTLERDWAVPRMIQPTTKLLYQKIMNRLQLGEIEDPTGRPNESHPSMGPIAGECS